MSEILQTKICCPSCDSTLKALGSHLQCESCAVEYPLLNQTPWLFPVPEHAFSFWRDNLKLQIQQIEQEVLVMTQSQNNLELFPQQKQRIKKWIEAKKEFARFLERILAPLVQGYEAHREASIALRDTIPMTQRLGSYLENIYRDWCWGDENGENQAALEIILQLVGDEKKALENILVLGAGTCRLAYDFHRAGKVTLTVASDINPLYLLLGQEMISGQSRSVFEFPLAPVDGKSFFVRRELKAPEAIQENFFFVFADAMNPPFQAGAFEGLLTPWFIDIVPQDPQLLFKRLNHLLKPGGIWLNFGSCFFNHPDFSRKYSPEEILEIAEKSGFEVEKNIIRKIPYLQSPASAHGRVEQTFSFLARKVKEVEQPPRFVYLPEWLLKPEKPIPLSPVFTQFAAVHGFYVQVVSAIDGKTSLETLAKNIGPQYGLSPQEATHSLGRFLTKIYENGLLFSV